MLIHNTTPNKLIITPRDKYTELNGNIPDLESEKQSIDIEDIKTEVEQLIKKSNETKILIQLKRVLIYFIIRMRMLNPKS